MWVATLGLDEAGRLGASAAGEEASGLPADMTRATLARVERIVAGGQSV
ncbi:MAG: hypothetical protein ACK5IN_05225 [Microbacterium sp.]